MDEQNEFISLWRRERKLIQSRLYEKAKTGEDYETARRCQDSALVVLAQLEAKQPKKGKVYAEILFTNDPAALKARMQVGLSLPTSSFRLKP